MDCSTPCSSVFPCLLEFAQIHVRWGGDLTISSFFPASVGKRVGSSIRWPKYWNFSNNPCNEYSELISFRIDWFDLRALETQESAPAPQFKSINFSALSFLYSPALTPVPVTGLGNRAAFRKWQPTPVFLPGESQGQRSLVGCCPWGHTESDPTEVT